MILSRFCWLCVVVLSLCVCHTQAATLYVAQKHPAARDAGKGDFNAPYMTISYALARLQPGDRLVIGEGVYREMLDLRFSPSGRPDGDASTGGPTIIEGASGEEVVIKGSDAVAEWQALGNGVFVRRAWNIPSQQVFLDGVPLKQIGGRIFNGFPSPNHPFADLMRDDGGIWPGRVPGTAADLVENSFHFDETTGDLLIKVALSGLEGHSVEVSTRERGLFGSQLQHFVFRNLRFTHSNGSAIDRLGMIDVSGTDLSFESIQVINADLIGMKLSGTDIVVKDCVVNFSGQTGITAKGLRFKFIGNETSYNNTRGFNKWWDAGGAKFIGTDGGLKDSEIAGHKAFFNDGDGIWLDTRNDNVKIHHGVFAYNKGFGIHYEASTRGYIYSNQAFSNALRGIYVFQSSESVVAHNLVVANGLEGIAVLDANRRDPTGVLDYEPKANRIVGNILAWNGMAMAMPANILTNASDYNLFVDEREETTFSLIALKPTSSRVHSMKAWRSLSQLELNSGKVVRPMSRELFDSLCKFRRDPDFRDLTSLGQTLAVPYPAPVWFEIPRHIPVGKYAGPA